MKSEGRFRILHADGFSLLLEVITGTTFFGFGQVFEREATAERYRLVNVGS